LTPPRLSGFAFASSNGGGGGGGGGGDGGGGGGGGRSGEGDVTKNIKRKGGDNTPVPINGGFGSWSCGLCTYLNHYALNVCEICGYNRVSNASYQNDFVADLRESVEVLTIHCCCVMFVLIF
jgi:hypothetical protein